MKNNKSATTLLTEIKTAQKICDRLNAIQEPLADLLSDLRISWYETRRHLKQADCEITDEDVNLLQSACDLLENKMRALQNNAYRASNQLIKIN